MEKALVSKCAALLLTVAPALNARSQTAVSPRVRCETLRQDIRLGAATNARVVLHKSLAALGGEEPWSNIHSSTLQYDATPFGTLSKRQIVMHDDWSENKLKLQREIAHEDKHEIHVENEVQHLASGNNQALPAIDLPSTLAGHVPAASLAVVLSDHHYDFCLLDSVDGQSPYVEVAVYKMNTLPNSTSQTMVAAKEMEWELSRTTLLPHLVRVLLPTLPPNKTGIWREYRFDAYQNVGGLLLPSTITSTTPGNLKRTLTLTNAQFNPKLSPTIFNEETGK